VTASPTTVGLLALFTAIATGFGALPLLFARRFSPAGLGLANALAGGLMLAASIGLVYEGALHGAVVTLIGAAIGGAFVIASHAVLGRNQDLHIGQLRGADARKALLIVGVMTLHSVTEGVGVGVAFGDGQKLGLLITLVIAIHNVPEGLAISLVLVPRGTPVWRAALWSVFSSIPQPLLAVPAFLAVERFKPLLGAGLGFAAGAMVWMALHELIPEALEVAPRGRVYAVIAVAVAAMLAAQFLLTT
jgi:zinc transporter ZupT